MFDSFYKVLIIYCNSDLKMIEKHQKHNDWRVFLNEVVFPIAVALSFVLGSYYVVYRVLVPAFWKLLFGYAESWSQDLSLIVDDTGNLLHSISAYSSSLFQAL